MASNQYEFLDRFTAPCDVETAWDYVSKPENYPLWWGNIYKEATRLPDGSVKVVVGGFLPYTLTIFNKNTLVKKPFEMRFEAWGDLQGKGAWRLEESARGGDGGTLVTFDSRVSADKAVIRWFSFLLKPLFRANHRYCVVAAEKGLRADLMKKAAAIS